MSNRPFKRPRTTFQVSQKRPIDKSLIMVSQTAVSTTQLSTNLITATFPCTITGLRWNLGFHNNSAAVQNTIYWAIVIVKDGNSANALAISDGSTFYEPEQNIIAWGSALLADTDIGGTTAHNIEGSTKSMRKLMGGDTIQLIYRASDSNMSIKGGVQFFCKS